MTIAKLVMMREIRKERVRERKMESETVRERETERD